MQWVKERDLLIAQTMAFVQSVTGKKPDAEPDIAAPAIGAAPGEAMRYAMEIVEPPIEPRKDHQIRRTSIPGDFRTEILDRVANFRAHQQRFRREREEYCSATLAKMHAAIGEDSKPAPLAK
jgi:hypothetical protein